MNTNRTGSLSGLILKCCVALALLTCVPARVTAADATAGEAAQAVVQADALFAEKNYQEASFYYAYALERISGDTSTIEKYAKNAEALIQVAMASGELEQAQQFLDQYRLFLAEQSFAVPLADVPVIRERLSAAEVMQSQLDGVAEAQASETVVDGSYLREQIGLLTSIKTDMTNEQLQGSIELREAILEVVADDPEAISAMRLEEIHTEIRTAEAILFERQASLNFQQLWEQADREEGQSTELAAFILQGAESLLRQRVDVKEFLPAAMQSTIVADLARLNLRSQQLMDKALITADTPLMDEAGKVAGIAADSGSAQLEESLAQLLRILPRLKYIDNIEAVSQKADEYRTALGESANRQMNDYNRWAVQSAQTAWVQSVPFFSALTQARVQTDKKGVAEVMIRYMASIDTTLLNRDATALYQLVYGDLFNRLDAPGDENSSTVDTNQMYVAEQFFKTPKRALSSF